MTDLRSVDWRKRNEIVEAAMRAYLSTQPVSAVFSTKALSEVLSLGEPAYVGSVLTKLAPWMGSFATHDGEEFVAYGRTNKRWRWHGQAGKRIDVV